MKKFRLIKEYPTLSREIRIGDLVYCSGVFYETVNKYSKSNCDEKFSIAISRMDVENNPKYWEEVRIKNIQMKTEKKVQSIEFINRLPRIERYFTGINDQLRFLKAANKFWKNKKDHAILEKYRYIGIPPIVVNYENAAQDFPELGKILLMENLLTYCKEYYPIGTVIKPFNRRSMWRKPIFTVVDEEDYYLGHFSTNEEFDSIWVTTGRWKSVIYFKGKWAKIIDK